MSEFGLYAFNKSHKKITVAHNGDIMLKILLYAGNPLESLVPKCNNLKNWAISRKIYWFILLPCCIVYLNILHRSN